MTAKRKICVVSSSRADYNHLHTLMSSIKKSRKLKLQIIVTGMHLLPEYGSTYKEISSDGFSFDGKIKSYQNNTNDSDILNSISHQIGNCSKVITKLKPDIIVLLGDRYDIFPVAIACHIIGIPLAHIHGGEVTYGAIDDSIRHMITKMSDLHFVASTSFKKRVIQLGENPKNIFNIGSLGIDAMKDLVFRNQKEIYNLYNIPNESEYLVISVHPETINKNNTKLINNLLKTLNGFKQYFLIFTYPNSDTGSNEILDAIKIFIKKNKSSKLVKSAGRVDYLSLVKYSLGLIGNSSSGLVEAPALNVPSINIGNRQEGRPLAKSVLSCNDTIKEINKSIKQLDSVKKNRSISYKGRNMVDVVLKVLATTKLNNIKLKKFYDINQ
mgnify:CR=1 FL=1